jgi:hypothetical protein
MRMEDPKPPSILSGEFELESATAPRANKDEDEADVSRAFFSEIVFRLLNAEACAFKVPIGASDFDSDSRLPCSPEENKFFGGDAEGLVKVPNDGEIDKDTGALELGPLAIVWRFQFDCDREI